jgi:dinuclear metal center YbgI/SA1388 family protein
VIVTLDVSEETVEKAAVNCSLIIAHHPLVFKPLKSLSGTDVVSRIVRLAVKHDVPVFAAHTNLDRAPGGVGDALADTLGLTVLSKLEAPHSTFFKFVTFAPADAVDGIRRAAGKAGAGTIGNYSMCSFETSGTGTFIPSADANPYSGEPGVLSRETEVRLEMIVPAHLADTVVAASRSAHPYEEMAYDLIPLENADHTFGYGAVGNLDKSMSPDSFARHVAECLGVGAVTISGTVPDSIRRVAVMGGKGRDFIGRAASMGADAYVTGELGHHDYIECPEGMMLVDATHCATERPVLEAIRSRLAASEPGESLVYYIEDGRAPFRVINNFT